MPGSKSEILAQLQREILPLQGFKPTVGNVLNIGLGSMEKAFPNNRFPLGAIHEFIGDNPEQMAATGGFISCLLASLMRDGDACIWISSSRTIFPPSLKSFGLEPDRILFIDLKKEKNVCWAMEESLKCAGLAAVVGEIREIDFTASRRLQLAVEQSRVTGFLVRQDPRRLGTTASVSRWRIKPISSAIENEMPGLGFPRWNIELQKIRNGKPGSWQMEWSLGEFHAVLPNTTLHSWEEKRKTG